MAEVPQIEGYSDLVRVAKGGFGSVYRARQDRFGRVVALKVLNVADLDDRGRKRFERECLAMGSLSWHPNVVALHDSGITTEGQPYLVMEYLDAGSLGDRLKAGPLRWQEAVVAGVQIAGALGVAHAAGILHRDIKPENLLVGPYGEAELGDFGIAALEDSTRTTASHASFTVAHVAPEILQGMNPDERSDLYSLASTLHTLISGSPPFASARDEPVAAVMMRVLQDPAPRLIGVPGDLASLLLRSLAKEPAGRPKSAAEFGRQLQSVQADNGQPVTDLRLAPSVSAAPPVASSPSEADTAPLLPTQRGDARPTIRQAPTRPHHQQSALLPHDGSPVAEQAAPTAAPHPPESPRSGCSRRSGDSGWRRYSTDRPEQQRRQTGSGRPQGQRRCCTTSHRHHPGWQRPLRGGRHHRHRLGQQL